MNGNGRRNDISIVAEILRLAENEAGQTRIMYGTNLNYGRLKHYLGLLEHAGYLEIVLHNPRIGFRTTAQGKQALRCIEQALQMLEPLNWQDSAVDRGTFIQATKEQTGASLST